MRNRSETMKKFFALMKLTEEESKVFRELDKYTGEKFLQLSHSAREIFMNRRAVIKAEQEQREAERLAEDFYSDGSEPKPEPENDEDDTDSNAKEKLDNNDFIIGWHFTRTGNGCYHARNNASATYYRLKQLDEKITKLSEIVKHINDGGNVSIKYGQESSYRIEKTDDLICELLRLFQKELINANTEFYNYSPLPFPEKQNK